MGKKIMAALLCLCLFVQVPTAQAASAKEILEKVGKAAAVIALVGQLAPLLGIGGKKSPEEKKKEEEEKEQKELDKAYKTADLQQVAEWAAIRYTADHIFDYMEIDGQHAIFEVEVPHEWIGKSVGELNIRRKYGINILGIKHSGKTDVSITSDTVLSGEITILALGEYKALQKCFRI